jgi:predicted dienelactone hydrolase
VWAQGWVQAGIGVLQLQFPGADAAVYAPADPAVRNARLNAAISPAAQEERVADIRFVLDELARRRDDSCGMGRVDLDRLGLAGHSIGAWAVQTLAGQGGGRMVDRRIRAFAAFSGTALPPPQRQAAYAGMRAPVLIISGSRDGLLPPGDAAELAATRDARTGMFAAMPADGRKALLWLAGADHMAFAGSRSGGDAARINAAVLAATTGWWRRWLLDDRAAMPTLTLSQGDEWQRK